MSSARRLRLALAALAGGTAYACASGAVARADSALVSLVRPSASTPSAQEALNRIEGELTAEGFEVVIVDSPLVLETGLSEASQVPAGTTDRPDRDAVASIELVVDASEHAAELRVIDRLTNKTVVRRATIEATAGPQFAQVLAVRAVELLRASLVELLILAHPPPSATAKAVVERVRTWAADSLQVKRAPTFGFDAGAALLVGFGGIGPAMLGVLRVRRALGRALQIRATIAGLGTQPTVRAPSGSASIGQDLGMIEVLAAPWEDRIVHPVVSVGAGPLFVSVDGQAAWPYAPVQSSGWSAAFDAGAGINVRLSQHFDLSLEAHAVVTEPDPVTRFVGQEQARVSQPSTLSTLTVVGWL